jgi:hypothetical protein
MCLAQHALTQDMGWARHHTHCTTVAAPCTGFPHLLELCRREGTGDVLFVGKDEQRGTKQALLLQRDINVLS